MKAARIQALAVLTAGLILLVFTFSVLALAELAPSATPAIDRTLAQLQADPVLVATVAGSMQYVVTAEQVGADTANQAGIIPTDSQVYAALRRRLQPPMQTVFLAARAGGLFYVVSDGETQELSPKAWWFDGPHLQVIDQIWIPASDFQLTDYGPENKTRTDEFNGHVFVFAPIVIDGAEAGVVGIGLPKGDEYP